MSMHIDASPGQIAETVILAGDPERVRHISETYLKETVLVNDKRAALCYTGTYKDVPLSVMATGMGIPSMLIYATELFRDYGCERLIRIGTGAAYKDNIEKYSMVLSQAACHTSGINDHLFNGTFCPIGDFGLLCDAYRAAVDMDFPVYVGNTVCNDRFYRFSESSRSDVWKGYGALCSEMEAAGLYTAAAQFGKRALTIVSILSKIRMDDAKKEIIERLPENGRSIDDAIILALETAYLSCGEG